MRHQDYLLVISPRSHQHELTALLRKRYRRSFYSLTPDVIHKKNMIRSNPLPIRSTLPCFLKMTTSRHHIGRPEVFVEQWHPIETTPIEGHPFNAHCYWVPRVSTAIVMPAPGVAHPQYTILDKGTVVTTCGMPKLFSSFPGAEQVTVQAKGLRCVPTAEKQFSDVRLPLLLESHCRSPSLH